MASIIKRNKSYFIAVSCGYDHNGKQIRRTMTYKPDKNLTERQIQKEVQRQAVLFEEQVRNGQVSSGGRLKLADFVPMYLETAKQKLSPYVYAVEQAERQAANTLELILGGNRKTG